MNAIDEQVEAVWPVVGQPNIQQLQRYRKRKFLSRSKICRGLGGLELGQDLSYLSTILIDESHGQLMLSIGFGWMNHDAKRKTSTERRGICRPMNACDAAAKNVKQCFPNGDGIADQGTINPHLKAKRPLPASPWP